MKYIFFILFIFSCCSDLFAQQDEHFTQYRFNKLLINPAYAGSKNCISSTLSGRYQWVGFEGAPVTQAISIHGPVLKKHLGLGIHIINDRVGQFGKSSIVTSYAWHLRSRFGNLAMGLQASVVQARFFGSKLNITNNNDPLLPVADQSAWVPDAAFGLYYYFRSFYVSLSGLHLTESEFNYSSLENTTIGQLSRHFYGVTGYNIEFSPDLILNVNGFVKYVQPAPIQYDINMNLIINNVFWTGLSYRSDDAASFLVGYYINERLRFGYSYDYTISQLSGYNSGSHEIMLAYDVLKIGSKYSSFNLPKLRRYKEGE